MQKAVQEQGVLFGWHVHVRGTVPLGDALQQMRVRAPGIAQQEAKPVLQQLVLALKPGVRELGGDGGVAGKKPLVERAEEILVPQTALVARASKLDLLRCGR